MLFVDLTTREMTVTQPDYDLYRDYLGGYGLGARVIFDRQPGGVDPLGPQNTLGFTTGPLVGTPAITGCRFTVCGKSPLTGTWGDSNCGGYFGPALKMAGFDAVFFSGIAAEPVYLLCDVQGPQLLPAGDLWGRDAFYTEDELRRRHGGETKVACIGPAGERLSPIAAIINDYGRAAGRSGMAAVMGSKKLKAVAALGAGDVPLADPAAAAALRRKYIKEMAASPRVKHFNKYGTIDHVASSAFSNDSPVRNWSMAGVDFPTATKISDDALLAYQFGKYACWRCNIACGGKFRVKDGPYKTDDAHKPEYETCAMFGNNMLNDNVESLIKINDICNRYGVDTISAGATIAWAIECFQEGLLTTADTAGLELRWGDHAAIVEATQALAEGVGFGAVLQMGSAAAARAIGRGTERYAIHVGGQELPAHDPKYAPSWGTYYVTDATPGRHTQLGLVTYENGPGLPGLTLPVAIERHQYKGKGEWAAKVQNIMHAAYCCGLCMFAIQRMDVNGWPAFLAAATGDVLTLDDFERIGRRVAALRGAFNMREGIAPKTHFKLPDRARGVPPLTKGPLEDVTIDLETLTSEYFAAQGWDELGRPTEVTLRELGLADVAAALYR
jgi:aldehyde:ferredoxin oxidoreductase